MPREPRVVRVQECDPTGRGSSHSCVSRGRGSVAGTGCNLDARCETCKQGLPHRLAEAVVNHDDLVEIAQSEGSRRRSPKAKPELDRAPG